ncbi:hypothetical protein Tco_0839848 [Tanacetum coccineum]|uniref:Retrovirus-related Pol polyprotein from transposon TNT 1-94 n=1 Tax=Tanacetum coccineum TaxID=301880 RepID=A0ABQ5AWC3_9ASTR
MKNNLVCKENASNVFRKEREQYHEIQDLKAQMQDKNIAISELKKLSRNWKESLWVPTGKLLNSCTGKVDSEPAHGLIVDIPHIHACKQTLGLSAGTPFNGQKQQRIDLNADALYNEKQENLRVWLLKFLISKKPVPECSDLAPQRQMASAENNSSGLGPVPQCSKDFIKEQVENGIIELYFVRTEYQLADMFTKALPEDRFKYLVRRIGMRCLTPAELEVLTNETA